MKLSDKEIKEGCFYAPYNLIIESTIITDKNGTTIIRHIGRFKKWRYSIENVIYNTIVNTLK
jgi:hypothetical protein